jgi:hypothetical protein
MSSFKLISARTLEYFVFDCACREVCINKTLIAIPIIYGVYKVDVVIVASTPVPREALEIGIYSPLTMRRLPLITWLYVIPICP